jgi:carboxypeptidase T
MLLPGEDDPPPQLLLLSLGDEELIVPQTVVEAQGALQNTAQVLAPTPVQPLPPPIVPHYHSYDELFEEIRNVARSYLNIVYLESIGKSYEGRTLWVARITKDAGDYHPDRPAVLFTGGQHAREHLGVEMCLFILQALTANYGKNAELTNLVDRLVIFIVFNVNPDGSEFDFKNPGSWRKNRQPNVGSTDVGTDLNRNWAWKWQAGGVAQPYMEDYDGPAPFSAPETAALSAFITEHAMDGTERIRGAIDFHTYGELVLYPFGYTTAPTTDDGTMSTEQHNEFLRLARLMRDGMHAKDTPDYLVMQSGKQEVGKCGLIIDWEWAMYRILAFTIELYPSLGSSGTDKQKFYPDYQKVVPRELIRAFGAVRVLLREIAARHYG